MCGIFGIMTYNVEDKYKQAQEIATRIIGTEILQLLEDRGKDATGVVSLFEDCSYMGLKMGVSATEFLSRFGNEKEDYEGWLDKMRLNKSPVKMFVGHCRKSSVGNSTDNSNNHPIHIHNKLIGVHNGTLKNSDAIFHNLKCKRDGAVDSEGILRLLYHFLNEGNDPFTKEVILETCKRMHGTYAVIAMNSINPNQLAVFRDGRPLSFVLIKKLNLLVIASEEKYLKHAIFKYNKLAALYKLKDDFVRLIKNDIEFKSLTDDSLTIFDNRIEITTDTKLADLIDEEKIPRHEKVWKNKIIEKTEVNKLDNDKNEKETTVTLIGDIISGHEKNGNTDVKQLSFDQNKSCLLWSFKFDKLGLKKDDKIVDDLGNIEIDTSNDKIYELKNLNKILLVKYSSVKNEELETDIKNTQEKSTTLIETSNINIQTKTKDTPIYINNKLYDKNTNKKDDKTVIIENTESNKKVYADSYVDPIKLSELSSKYHIKRYATDHEAMKAIEIVDKNIIKALPFYSLCNRIKRFSFKEGFYNGYTQRIKEENKDTKQLQSKKDKAEKKIRVLKTLSKVLSKIVFDCTTFNIFDVKEGIEDAFKQKQEIDSKTLKSIYSNRDLKDSRNGVINKITTLLEMTK